MTLLTLIYLRSLLKLRRHLRLNHRGALDFVLSSDWAAPVFGAVFGKTLAELSTLQMACFDPTKLPVQVLADDTVFDLVKRVRRGILVEFYGQMGYLAVKSLKDL